MSDEVAEALEELRKMLKEDMEHEKHEKQGDNCTCDCYFMDGKL